MTHTADRDSRWLEVVVKISPPPKCPAEVLSATTPQPTGFDSCQGPSWQEHLDPNRKLERKVYLSSIGCDEVKDAIPPTDAGYSPKIQ